MFCRRMRQSSRRTLLRAVAAAGCGVSGCLNRTLHAGRGSPTAGRSPTPDATPADPDALTTWERSTDCDAMHDSAIAVDAVANDLPDDRSPIGFGDLTDGEQEILGTVTTEGGYATCEVSESFQRFLGRVRSTVEEQDGTMRLWLARDGRYYRLYVEKRDQVFAY